jgi:hypothetical protein
VLVIRVALPGRRSRPRGRGEDLSSGGVPRPRGPEPQWVRTGALEPAGREGIVAPSHHCLSSLAKFASPAISLTVDHEDADDGP